jgi:hypothetical protein
MGNMKFDGQTIAIIAAVAVVIIGLYYYTNHYNFCSPNVNCDCVGVTAAAQGLLLNAVDDMSAWWYNTLEGKGFDGIKKEPITIALNSFKTSVNKSWGRTPEEAKAILSQMSKWGVDFNTATNITTTPGYLLIQSDPVAFRILTHFIGTIYFVIQNVSGPTPVHGMCA